MSLTWSVPDLSRLGTEPTLECPTAPLEVPAHGWRSDLERWLRKTAPGRKLPAPFHIAALETDFVGTFEAARAQYPGTPFTLIFNSKALPFTASTTTDQASLQFRRAFGEDEHGHIDGYLSTGLAYSDQDPHMVFTVANAIAYCRLTGRELLLAGNSYLFELKVGPNSKLGSSIFEHVHMPGITDNPATASERIPEKLPRTGALTVVDVQNSLLSTSVVATLRTDLDAAAVWEVLRQRFIAVDSSRISNPAPGQIVVQYPEYENDFCGKLMNHALLEGHRGMEVRDLRDAFPSTDQEEFEDFRRSVFRIETVREYYRRIDAGDNEWVVRMFAPDAEYQRADSTMRGVEALRAFYVGGERKIRGVHTMTRLDLSRSGDVLVEGEFRGTGAKGQPVQTGFSDRWRFEGNQVGFRKTTLAQGASYVKE